VHFVKRCTAVSALFASAAAAAARELFLQGGAVVVVLSCHLCCRDWVERLRTAGAFEAEEPTVTQQQLSNAGGATALANVQQFSARPHGKLALPGGWHCHSDALGATKITAYVSQHADTQHNSCRYGALRVLACRDAERSAACCIVATATLKARGRRCVGTIQY
jgi:hypothetical protein